MRMSEEPERPERLHRAAPHAGQTVPAPVASAFGAGGRLTPAAALALQRSAGNAAVVAMLRRQADDDPHASTPDPDAACHRVLSTPGRPMEDTLRAEMEARLGADFRHVRLHNDVVAQRSAKGIGARAYTSRHHVVGADGKDKHTLAHELTHVMQQQAGPVSGTATGGGLSISDPSDRFEREAEANARRVMSGAVPVQRELTDREQGTPATGPVVVQRDAAEDLEIGDHTWKVNSGYQAEAFNALRRYRTHIGYLMENAQYGEHVNAMAKGYRAWNENYYNKNQAYLFEAQKVAEVTRTWQEKGGGGHNSLACLGSDTDKEPDIAVFHEHYIADANGKVSQDGQWVEAVEIKASTSALPESVDGLVAGGIAQLKKREDTKNFTKLTLELHMDNPNNYWPLTTADFNSTYKGSFANVQKDDWDNRLKQRIGALKNTKGITLPLSVRAYFGGHSMPYAEAEA